MNEVILHLAEQIDKVMTIDLSGRGVADILYACARERAGGPVAFAAARSIFEARKKEPGYVFIATGFPDRPQIDRRIAETDGPPGAAALARALHLACHAVPVILVEEDLVPAMTSVMEAAGLRCLDPVQAASSAHSIAPLHAASVMAFPTGTEEARRASRELLSLYEPWAVVCTEKAGMNDRGVIHTMRGHDITPYMAKIDYLMMDAGERGVLTIGVGDGGNEIGMGAIQDGVRRSVPYGEKCQCGCGSGVAPATVTESLVVAAVSNWGCYGVAACLAILAGEPRFFHDAAIERAMLEACARSSLIDGCTGLVGPSVDGLPAHIHVAVVEMLGQLIATALRCPWRQHDAPDSPD
ncbi:MAG: glutamate cyclase domain-containing protein [Ignavibacteriales bacterium]